MGDNGWVDNFSINCFFFFIYIFFFGERVQGEGLRLLEGKPHCTGWMEIEACLGS